MQVPFILPLYFWISDIIITTDACTHTLCGVREICQDLLFTGGMIMAVTLQQIAEAAGVSRGTVDRALNNRGRINPEVSDNIKRIAKEMGYQPNRAGRALAMSRKSIAIGVIVQAAGTPFMENVLDGIAEAKEEVERLGAEVMIKKIQGLDAEKAVEAMKELKAAGCNGLVIVPVDDEALRQTVDDFADDNIPVITFNSDIEASKRLCFVGQDTLKSGKVAGGLMAEILPEGGTVLVISGYPSNQAHKNRTKGFTQELAKRREDIRILDVQYAFDDNQMAEMITKGMLGEYEDLSGIYLSASGVQGVCAALEEKKLPGRVKVISNDLTAQNIKCLEEGKIQFLIGQNGYVQGYEPIMMMFNKIFDGKDPDEEFAYTEIVIKTKNNL